MITVADCKAQPLAEVIQLDSMLHNIASVACYIFPLLMILGAKKTKLQAWR